MKLNDTILMVIRYLRNAFESGSEGGNFTIEDGKVALSDAYYTGEWIAITGSRLNNGVFQLSQDETGVFVLSNGTDGEIPKVNETFDGKIWRLALPRDFVALCLDLQNWLISPAGKPSNITKESVLGYYSKTFATSENGAPLGWIDMFSNRINSGWRKMWESELVRTL